MNKWKEDYDRITKSEGATGSESKDISQTLSSALDEIPQMTEKKKKVDMHV
jgi:hypothetical protein